MPDEIDNDLGQAIEGLLYMSETDASFEIVHWPDGAATLDAKQVLKLSRHKAKDPVQTLSVDDFFKPLTDYPQAFIHYMRIIVDVLSNQIMIQVTSKIGFCLFLGAISVVGIPKPRIFISQTPKNPSSA